MKIQLNKTKPFYVNKIGKKIRMGNFPETGKEIEYEDDSFVTLINRLTTPVDYDSFISDICKEIKLSKSDVKSTLDYLIAEGFVIRMDDLYSIEKNELLNRELLYFYMTSDYNLNDHLSLVANKKILILGLGSIGSIALNLLIRAGFTNFTIIDCDKVEKSNLNRQLLYDIRDLECNKTDAIVNKAKAINESVEIRAINRKITKEEDIESEIKSSDFVLCTIDKPLRIIRRLINDLCVKYLKPVLFAGFTEHYGMIGPFVIPNKSACLNCIESLNASKDQPLDNVKTVPSYGPLCNLISSIVADEIINYYIGYKEYNLQGKTLMFNMHNYETKTISWTRNINCERCGNK